MTESIVPISWKSIVSALKSDHVGERGLAEQVRKKYCDNKEHAPLPLSLDCLKVKDTKKPIEDHDLHTQCFSRIEALTKQLEEKTRLLEKFQNSIGVHVGGAKSEGYHISGWAYETAPDSFSSDCGVSLFDVNKAYFLKKSRLYLYESDEKGGHWSELVNTRYQYCQWPCCD